MKKAKKKNNLSLTLTRITRTVYFVLGFYALSIVIFDSGNLITRESIIDRWLIFTFILGVNTFAWYMASQKNNLLNRPAILILTLSLIFLIFAGLTTYWERGMASTSTIFYALPLLIVATLKNRHALLTIATLSVGTYAFATVKYFNDYFNEGYRIQLWGSIVLYSGIIFACTWLIMVITGLRHDSE